MVTAEKTSGRIQIINKDDGLYTIVILDKFVGKIITDSSTCYLRFILHNNSMITNDIELSNSDKLDFILFEGEGSCIVQTVSATSIEVRANLFPKHLFGNVVKIIGCKLVSDIDSTAQPDIEILDTSTIDDKLRYIRRLLGEILTSLIDGLDIPRDKYWTIPEAKNAVVEAMNFIDAQLLHPEDVTQADIDAWVEALDKLIDDMNLQKGRLADKSALEEQINRAKALVYSISSLDGLDIPTSEKWLSPDEAHNLNIVLQNAENVFNTPYPPQELVDDVCKKLKDILDVTVLKPGKLADKSELIRLIAESENALSIYLVSDIQGLDIPTSEKWVETRLRDNLEACLPSAKAVRDNPYPTQEEVDKQARIVEQRLNALNPQDGRLADKSKLIRAISEGTAELPKYKVSSNGHDIWYTDKWITPEAKAELERCIAKGQVIVDTTYPTQEAVDAATNDINEAIISLSPQYGLKRYGPIPNDVIDKIVAHTLERPEKSEDEGIQLNRIDSILNGTAGTLVESELGIPLSSIDRIVDET